MGTIKTGKDSKATVKTLKPKDTKDAGKEAAGVKGGGNRGGRRLNP